VPDATLGSADPLHDTFMAAVAAFEGGQLADAERICLAVLDRKPGHFDAVRLLGTVNARRGRNDAALAWYDRALAIQPRHAETLSNRGNVLKDLDRLVDALVSSDKAIEAEPEFADAHYNRAVLLNKLKRFAEALSSYDTVLSLRPDHAVALNNRGNVLVNLARMTEAVASFDRAIAIRPDYAEAFNNRGVTLQKLDLFEEAVESYDKAIALKPDYAEAFDNRGVALKDLRRFDDALKSHRKAQELAPDLADSHWNEALLLLLTGDLPGGFAKYEWRWKWPSFTSPRRGFSQPLWDGLEMLYDRTILLHAEQGFGDTIQFCRYAPHVAARGARVILEVGEPLRRLMGSLGGVAQVVAKGETLPQFDVYCPLMSLPHAFNTQFDTVPAATPYLHPPADAAATWEAQLGATQRPRIGIVWAGNPSHANDRKRSIELAALKPLLAIDATFVSLQKELRPADKEMLQAYAGVLPLGSALKDFADTAALVSCLDLVISVDTSLAHLAGALAKPVYILLPHAPDWRWMIDHDTSPWYPTARLFRQNTSDDWNEVIARVASAVTGFATRESVPDGPNP
jgi:tetratricopeptide (TPR) repeat protein